MRNPIKAKTKTKKAAKGQYCIRILGCFPGNAGSVMCLFFSTKAQQKAAYTLLKNQPQIGQIDMFADAIKKTRWEQ